MKRFLLIYIFIIISLFSCEEKISFEGEYQNMDLIVVEALITNEYKEHEIILSKPFVELNSDKEYISDAKVAVYLNYEKVDFSEDSSNPGHYFADSLFIAVVDKYYTLEIIVDDKYYTAGTTIIPVLQPDSLIFNYDSLTGLYNLDFVASIVSDYESAMYELNFDFDNTIDVEHSDKATLYFYTFKTVDVCEIFAPEKEKFFFSKGTKIELKKYSMNDAHANFMRGILIETNWSGGLFDEANANPNTNLSPGAIGFFAVSSVIKKNYSVE